MSSPGGPEPRPKAEGALARRARAQGLGVVLFLFIPVVLYLFVRHPEPVWLSLFVGLALMSSHRLLARPYMRSVAKEKCLWSNRLLQTDPNGVSIPRSVTIRHRGGSQEARVLDAHAPRLRSFFAFAHAWRFVLAGGIFLPLLALLTSLLVAALGELGLVSWQLPGSLEAVTALFQLTVGITVNLAANGFLLGAATDQEPRVIFPAHNFFLLGIANLLWIFRLVGFWWILVGLAYFW